jgi:hypothetical protein
MGKPRHDVRATASLNTAQHHVKLLWEGNSHSPTRATSPPGFLFFLWCQTGKRFRGGGVGDLVGVIMVGMATATLENAVSIIIHDSVV